MKIWLFVVSSICILTACSSIDEASEVDTVDSSSEQELDLDLNLVSLNNEMVEVPEGDLNVNGNIQLHLDMFVGDYLDSYQGHDVSRLEGMMLPSSEIYQKHVNFFEKNDDRIYILTASRSYKKINDNKYQVINGEIHHPDHIEGYEQILILSVYTVEHINEHLYITDIEQNLLATDKASIEEWIAEQQKLEQARSNSNQNEEQIQTSLNDDYANQNINEHVESKTTLMSQIEESQALYDYYNNFRNDYAKALENIDYSYIENYFKEGSKISNDYGEFVLDHLNMNDYNYEYLSNELYYYEFIDENTVKAFAKEEFNFHSASDGSYYYDRDKKYIIKQENGRWYIEDIQIEDTIKEKI